MDQTKREGLAQGQTQGRKTKNHELIYEIGLLQACLKRQIILKMKHCSRSFLNALFLTLLILRIVLGSPFSGKVLSLIYSLFLHILTPYLYLTRFLSWHLSTKTFAEGGRRSCLAVNYTVQVTSSSMQLIKLLPTI